MMGAPVPCIVALAGPNGAGKSTAGPEPVRGALGVQDYVDADMIARGLSAFEPEAAAVAAGRVMPRRLRDLARRRASFAFETTLASRSFAPWVRRLVGQGFEFHVIFLWLPTPDFAVMRVQDRVRLGGHPVPDAIVRRRYERGLKNFVTLYRPLAATWRVYDNSGVVPKLIAAGRGDIVTAATPIWERIRAQVERA